MQLADYFKTTIKPSNVMEINHSFQKFLQTIGANLRKARMAKALDVETAAEAVRIPSSLLDQIEKGEYNMTIDLLDHLCQLYKIAPRDVATEKETQQTPGISTTVSK